MVRKYIYVFDKNNYFISKIKIPKMNNIISFHGYYLNQDILKIVFWTNDNYLYTATFKEDTFEFSDWGFTK